MSENGFRLDASDREKGALRTAPASLRNFRASGSPRHSAFKNCFGHFRAVQRVLGALLGRFVGTSGRHSAFWKCFFGTLGRHSAVWKCFFGTLGRHSAVWKRFFDNLPSKGSSEPGKNPKFQGHQNGGDFSTKKCSFYRVRRQILTEGLFTSWLIKISFKWSFYRS